MLSRNCCTVSFLLLLRISIICLSPNTCVDLFVNTFSITPSSSITRRLSLQQRYPSPSSSSSSSSSSLQSTRYDRRENEKQSAIRRSKKKPGNKSSNKNGDGGGGGGRKKKKQYTFKDLKAEIEKNPVQYEDEIGLNAAAKKKSKYVRTRKRVEQPKQKYLYSAQKRRQEEKEKLMGFVEEDISKQEPLDEATVISPNNEDDDVDTLTTKDIKPNSSMNLAKKFGLTNLAGQYCDPLIDYVEPEIMGTIRISEENNSGSFAYIVNKPPGWSIIGGINPSNVEKAGKKKNGKAEKYGSKDIKQVKLTDGKGSVDVIEYNEKDLLNLLTPEELRNYELEQEKLADESGTLKVNIREQTSSNGSVDTLEYNEQDIIALLSPEELEEYNLNKSQKDSSLLPSENTEEEGSGDSKAATYAKIESRIQKQQQQKANANDDSFATYDRPSIITWLKESKMKQGIPIRGGNYWKAIAGATSVDDTGLVLLCPKDQTENLFIEYAEYIAVVGNGKFLTPASVLKKKKKRQQQPQELSKESIKVDLISKLKKGREYIDLIQTVSVVIPDQFSTCDDVVEPLQSKFDDGIRGDPESDNSFDKRSERRLIHCNMMSVSSLVYDESKEVEAPYYPDDIAIVANRRNQHGFIHDGSFLGRRALRENPLTTAYREVNGEADGFPGWIIDRYDKWLLVQHDTNFPKGPLPSIHDGNTIGIYYLQHNKDRGAMGSTDAEVSFGRAASRPILLEGKRAPEYIEILENGVKYLVTLEKDLSTGIFLDQRLQRGWLTRNCNKNTSILNCFAHCGGYSIAAAAGNGGCIQAKTSLAPESDEENHITTVTGGASTVNIDLNSYWLDRIPQQLKINGIEQNEIETNHDSIYGDCFDWMNKLCKRGEKYDIVILDPPSSSYIGGGSSGGGSKKKSKGKKKKRWSVKNDMSDLVALASQLVDTNDHNNKKKGGLLWTTTNSESITPLSFANMCYSGFEKAGFDVGKDVKLEKIVPMPSDYPCIGPQNVKNFVWRIY